MVGNRRAARQICRIVEACYGEALLHKGSDVISATPDSKAVVTQMHKSIGVTTADQVKDSLNVGV